MKPETILDKALKMVQSAVTPSTVEDFLFTKEGRLCTAFPSRKVREWALRMQEEWRLPHSNRLTPPLLYAALRRVFKELEFDLGRNANVGWAVTTHMEIEDGLKEILKARGVEVDDSVRELVKEYAEKIEEQCRRVAKVLRRCLTGGASYGALRWYAAFGCPKSMTFMFVDNEGAVDEA